MKYVIRDNASPTNYVAYIRRNLGTISWWETTPDIAEARRFSLDKAQDAIEGMAAPPFEEDWEMVEVAS